VDTRTKILTPAAAAALQPARPLLLVTGYFDILRAETARDLAEARRRSGAQSVVVAVLPLAGEMVPQAARAEMVAALRVVDYVLLAENEDRESLAAALQPVEIVGLEEAEACRTRQLIEHVHSRQSR
jgi:bifunctional ADP-heptose synthase (sugar kinase/adenylyltransferase)